MSKEKIKRETFLLGETIVTDIIWRQHPNANRPLTPHVLFKPLRSFEFGKECEVTKIAGYCLSFLKRNRISKGSKVEIYASGAKEHPDYIYIHKVIECGNGDYCIPQNTFLTDGEVWEDTEDNHKYVAFRKGLSPLLNWNEIDTLYGCGIKDVISLAEYLQGHDHLTVIKDISQNWHAPSNCLVDTAISLKQKFSELDYFEFLKLLNLPKLRNCELKIIALRMSGYGTTEVEMKNIRKKAVEEFLKDKDLCNRIKAVAKPTAKLEPTIIVSKTGNSISMELRNLPKSFSFAYTFFRNIEQECRLLKIEIEKAQKNGDKVTAAYLEAAKLFLNEHMAPKNFYVGGISVSHVLAAIQTLTIYGKVLFKDSVALCVRDRIEREINAIQQEYEYCIMLARIIPDKVEQVITIISRADTEEEAIEKLQLELSLTVGEAECLCAARLDAITDKELVTQKIKSMKFLLAYLKHLKAINT